MRQKPIELPALTSLRGIAALSVLLFHANNLASNVAGAPQSAFLRHGHLAVDLFFFLSGFVLTHVYGRALVADNSWRQLRAFFWARFCRLYPIALFTTAMFLIVAPSLLLAPHQMMASLLFMQVPWLRHVYLNPPSWSVSAEIYAYLLFPFIAPAILRIGRISAAVLAAGCFVIVTGDHFVASHVNQAAGWQALVRSIPEFTTGVFAYRLYTDDTLGAVWRSTLALPCLALAIVTAAWANVSDAVIVGLMPALLLTAVSNSGWPQFILSAGPLRWLGEISYSVYMFQMLVILIATRFSGQLVNWGLDDIWFQLIVVVASIAAGAIVHRRVDAPARAALRRLALRIPNKLAAAR